MLDDFGGRPTGITRHLVPESVWREQECLAQYRPEGFAVEGFVHCTDGDDLVLEVANRYYRDDGRSYLLLDVDLARVRAQVIYEDDERRYPHIYDSIAREAVRRVRRLLRDADGSFTAVADEDFESST
jgi:uncharacterized protein (DUF952 family)